MADNFSLEIFEKLNFWHNYKNKEGTRPPWTNLRHLKTWETTPERCFLYWKLFLLSSWKTSKKLLITGSNFSNVVGTTLRKLLSIMVHISVFKFLIWDFIFLLICLTIFFK